MDGPHDLGGKDGFGSIDVGAPDFRENWERRQWALSKNIPLHGGTIDWWRHGIENMDPVAYLSLPYFEKWCLNEIAQRIDQDMFTMDEIVTGQLASRQATPPVRDKAEAIQYQRSMNRDFQIEMADPPAFAIGDRVKTLNTPVSGHTRLPAYARGHEGRIIAHHGGHLYADAGAKGEHIGAHLYTVEFTARELWATDDADTVCLDLWEPYLVGA